MANHVATTTVMPARVMAWLALGFLAGGISVLVFHQGVLGLLNALEFTSREPYSMQPTAPLGLSELWSLAFWGGVWGILLAMVLWRLLGLLLVVAAVALGAVLPTLVAWFVVAPLKGQPLAAGGEWGAMATAIVINGAWGLGTGLGLALFSRRRSSTF